MTSIFDNISTGFYNYNTTMNDSYRKSIEFGEDDALFPLESYAASDSDGSSPLYVANSPLHGDVGGGVGDDDATSMMSDCNNNDDLEQLTDMFTTDVPDNFKKLETLLNVVVDHSMKPIDDIIPPVVVMPLTASASASAPLPPLPRVDDDSSDDDDDDESGYDDHIDLGNEIINQMMPTTSPSSSSSDSDDDSSSSDDSDQEDEQVQPSAPPPSPVVNSVVGAGRLVPIPIPISTTAKRFPDRPIDERFKNEEERIFRHEADDVLSGYILFSNVHPDVLKEHALQREQESRQVNKNYRGVTKCSNCAEYGHRYTVCRLPWNPTSLPYKQCMRKRYCKKCDFYTNHTAEKHTDSDMIHTQKLKKRSAPKPAKRVVPSGMSRGRGRPPRVVSARMNNPHTGVEQRRRLARKQVIKKKISKEIQEDTCCSCLETTLDDDLPVLLCDGCEGEYHFECSGVPMKLLNGIKNKKNKWYCYKCAERRNELLLKDNIDLRAQVKELRKQLHEKTIEIEALQIQLIEEQNKTSESASKLNKQIALLEESLVKKAEEYEIEKATLTNKTALERKKLEDTIAEYTNIKADIARLEAKEAEEIAIYNEKQKQYEKMLKEHKELDKLTKSKNRELAKLK